MNFPFFKNKYFLDVLLSALLLTLAWPVDGLSGLLFIGFVPLLRLEQTYSESPAYKAIKLWGYVYLAFLLWNLGTTWWVWNSSLGGGIMAFTLNALLMSITFMLFHFTKRKLGNKWGYVAFVVYWLAFEYLHHNWDGNWPWLTLGNGFATGIKWVQWYEYTGTAGGSLWVLVANVLIFKVLLAIEPKIRNQEPNLFSTQYVALSTIAVWIVLPILISLGIYYTYYEKPHPVGIVVVQPNIDPYNEKFSGMPAAEQLAKTLRLAATAVDDSTRYIVTPETALPDEIWEEQLAFNPEINTIKAFCKAFHGVTFVGGISTAKRYKAGEKFSSSARKFNNADVYYDSYNTAMEMDSTGHIQLYHKSKLVPGVECMPFSSIMKYFEKLAINLGGTTGSLGRQAEPTIFTAQDSTKIGTAICYESIFGEWCTEYVQKGAQAIFIITNDGWWGNTPGYHQHLCYGRLRAIETRRSIARSANTGISCFINQRGDILKATNYWEPTVIKQSINLNDKITVYTSLGDYISQVAALWSVVLLGMLIFARKQTTINR